MKTTLDLDDDLVHRVKREAAARRETLREWVEDALRARLLQPPRRRPGFRLDLPVVRGDAPPRVDVADRDALYDLMERG